MTRVGEALSALFDKNMLQRAQNCSAFFSCWKDLMEKNGIASAADHSRIIEEDNGLVWIEVDHPGWKQIIQTKKSKLLHDFQYRFPDMNISGISIVLYQDGSGLQPERKLPKKKAKTKKSAKGREQDDFPPKDISIGYDAIKDEVLKNALKQLEKSISERESETKP